MAGTVIVPLDGSEQAEQALVCAQALAERRNAAMVLLSVVEISLDFDTWVDQATVSLEEEVREWLDDRRRYLEGVAERVGGSKTSVDVRAGRPSQEIAAYVEDADDPVIVMASHGRSGLEHVVIGSVAFRILHDVRCPVLVTRMTEGSAASPAPDFAKVMIPLDGSDFSESIIDRAVATLGEPVPPLHLLRVVEAPGWSPRALSRSGSGQYLEDAERQASEYLSGVADRLAGRGYDMAWEVRHGEVAAEILDSANAASASVIAMATHGRGGLGRALLGSVAQQVLQRSNTPLLLIRPEEA